MILGILALIILFRPLLAYLALAKRENQLPKSYYESR